MAVSGGDARHDGGRFPPVGGTTLIRQACTQQLSASVPVGRINGRLSARQPGPLTSARNGASFPAAGAAASILAEGRYRKRPYRESQADAGPVRILGGDAWPVCSGPARLLPVQRLGVRKAPPWLQKAGVHPAGVVD